MRTRLVQSLALLGAVTIFVLAANTVALAANGKGFLLGKANKASKATTLQRTKPGPALSLKTKSGPPLAVSSSAKVAGLNADEVDGKSATDFAPSSVTGVVSGLRDDVTELGSDVAVLDGKVGAANALTPIAAGYINADGSLGKSRGISTATVSNGSYTVGITGENYFYTNYVPMVTPECPGVSVYANSAGGKFYVSFTNTTTGQPTPCSFALSVIKPIG